MLISYHWREQKLKKRIATLEAKNKQLWVLLGSLAAERCRQPYEVADPRNCGHCAPCRARAALEPQ